MICRRQIIARKIVFTEREATLRALPPSAATGGEIYFKRFAAGKSLREKQMTESRK
jgi:hypothetical protein